MHKKGFIRTLEAVIAVIIVLGVILAVTPGKDKATQKTQDIVRQAQSFILEQVATNEQYRECILKSTTQGECKTVCTGTADIDALVKKNLPNQYEYRCEICSSASTCSGQLPLDKSLYTDSRFIATDPAKIIRLVFWEK